MKTLEDQLEWEQECSDRGAARYAATQLRVKESGQGDTADTVQHLFRERLMEVAGELKKQAYTTKGIQAHTNVYLRRVVIDEDWERIAFITLKVLFQAILEPRNHTLVQVAMDIGGRLETDIKCMIFEDAHPAYYNTVRNSFTTQKVSDYRHKHKVMNTMFDRFDLEWTAWAATVKAHIGTHCVNAALKVYGDVFYLYLQWEKNKKQYIVKCTEEFDKWSDEFEKHRGLMMPYLLPLKIPPKPWENGKGGGYHTRTLGHRLPFVKVKGKQHKKFVAKYSMEQHSSAVNKMQRTAWRVNTRVLDVQRIVYKKGMNIGIPSEIKIEPPPFPDDLREIDKQDLNKDQKRRVSNWKAAAKTAYNNEQQRRGQVLAFMQGFALAEEIKDWDELYFAYNCDFRGRVYCATSGLSPQGADFAKGLLHFARPVRFGESGIRWLAIQGSNTFGFDKASYSERVQFIVEKEDFIRAINDDPISSRELWGSADKPYQFLAFCFEWAATDYGRDKQAMGYLPVGLDGSCNGLQHFSAMLRDPVGARATNLTDNKLPSDIYQDVADVCLRKVQDHYDQTQDARARIWLQVGIDRKCAKRPVMTLPYGATQESARHYVMSYVQDNWSKFGLADKHQWEFACYLTPLLWESIGEVVVAARAAMDWLRKNTGNGFKQWVTPIGFPVYQYYNKVQTTRIKTQLNDGLTLSVGDINKPGKAYSAAQKNGVSPNFVHSIDSTHMIMTINACDFHSFAMIHDDYGTHAGNVEELAVAIRKQFHKLYTKHNPLDDWAEQQQVEPLSFRGSYDIDEILDADYFFG